MAASCTPARVCTSLSLVLAVPSWHQSQPSPLRSASSVARAFVSVSSAALIAFASVFKRRSSRLNQPQPGSPSRAGCPSPATRPGRALRRPPLQAALIAFESAPARQPQAPAAVTSHPSWPCPARGLRAGCRQSWPAAGRPQDRLGGCWWPPQPRGCIPDGTVAK